MKKEIRIGAVALGGVLIGAFLMVFVNHIRDTSAHGLTVTTLLSATMPSSTTPSGTSASGDPSNSGDSPATTVAPKVPAATVPPKTTTGGTPTSGGSPTTTVARNKPRSTTTTVGPNSGGTPTSGGSTSTTVGPNSGGTPTSGGSTTTTVAPTTGVSLGSAGPYSVIAGAAFTRGSSNSISGATLWSVAGESSGPWRDASNAYSNASGRIPTHTSGAIDFQTNLPLTAGVYRHTSYVSATDTLTLDGQGNSNAVFIFQISGYLSTEAGFRVVLTNGARADNVFWKVGSYFSPGASTIFKGTVVAGTYITTGASLDIDGRLFALSGAVTTGASNIIR